MAAMVPFAAKGAGNASQSVSKALTGDIYTRKWTTTKTKGKGKKKKTVVIDHELKANPVSVGLGLLAVGAAATGVGIAMWLTQRKLTHGVPEGGAKKRYIVKRYYPVYKTVTVVDVAAVPDKWVQDTPASSYWGVVRVISHPATKIEIPGSDPPRFVYEPAWDEERWGTVTVGATGHLVPGTPAVTHPEQVLVSAQRLVVTTLKGIPIRTVAGGNMDDALTDREKALGWVYEGTSQGGSDKDRLGEYEWQTRRYTNATKKKLGTGERVGFLG